MSLPRNERPAPPTAKGRGIGTYSADVADAIRQLAELGWVNLRQVPGRAWWLAEKGECRVANRSPRHILHHVKVFQPITTARQTPRPARKTYGPEARLQKLVGKPPTPATQEVAHAAA